MADSQLHIKIILLLLFFLIAYPILISVSYPFQIAYEYGGRELTPPDYDDPTSKVYLVDIGNWTLYNYGGTERKGVGNWNVDVTRTTSGGVYRVRVQIYDTFGPIHYNFRTCRWIDFNGSYRDTWVPYDYYMVNTTLAILYPNNVTGNFDNLIFYVERQGEVMFYGSFNFNSTKYSDCSEAWSNSELYLELGVDWDNIKTTYNIFNMFSSVFFVQIPNLPIHIKALIGTPMWVSFIIAVFIIMSRLIPLITGV